MRITTCVSGDTGAKDILNFRNALRGESQAAKYYGGFGHKRDGSDLCFAEYVSTKEDGHGVYGILMLLTEYYIP